MRDYYQSKNSTYRLPKPIYQKMVKTVQAYDYYRRVLAQRVAIREQGRPYHAVGQTEPGRFDPAADCVAAVDRALRCYVAAEYRQPVLRHLTERRCYAGLESEYSVSVSTLKRWTQRFLYGVALELGEFREPESEIQRKNNGGLPSGAADCISGAADSRR